MPAHGQSITAQHHQTSLQERLHTLLTRLTKTTEILRTWPSEDQHTQTTTQLIQSLHKVIDAIKQVEEKVNGLQSEELLSKLRQTAIPLDLLDMMDYGNILQESSDVPVEPSQFTGLNPDCFARGLLRESLRQIGTMNRRKASMKMLAASIQNGLVSRGDDTMVSKRMKLDG
jgi:hypothetical protein